MKKKTKLLGMTLLELLISAVIGLLIFVYVTDLLFRLNREYSFSVTHSLKVRQATNVLNGIENDLRGIYPRTLIQGTTYTGILRPVSAATYTYPNKFHAQNAALVFGTQLGYTGSAAVMGYMINTSTNKLKRIIYNNPSVIDGTTDTHPQVKVAYMGTDYFKDLTLQLVKNTSNQDWYYTVEVEIYLNYDALRPTRCTTYRLINKIFIKQ